MKTSAYLNSPKAGYKLDSHPHCPSQGQRRQCQSISRNVEGFLQTKIWKLCYTFFIQPYWLLCKAAGGQPGWMQGVCRQPFSSLATDSLLDSVLRSVAPQGPECCVLQTLSRFNTHLHQMNRPLAGSLRTGRHAEELIRISCVGAGTLLRHVGLQPLDECIRTHHWCSIPQAGPTQLN